MKKSLSLLVAIAMVFSMFATSVFAADEKTTEQKYDELVKAGIFAGLPGGEAGLDQTMTRAQAAVIIAKLAGYKDGVTSPDAGFKDVPAGHWAKPYVDFAANLGIISGLGDGNFGPSSNVTIEQLAKLAVDALAKLGYTLKDAVAVEGTVTEWAKEYVGKAIANGIFAAQADYTIPALRGLLVTASYSAYVALQVPAAIVVESVKAANSKTLVATFNVEVGTAVASNFTVHAKDDVYAINVVESVAIDGKTVKVSLTDSLDTETTYVVVAEGVVSKENNLVLASTSKEVTYAATAAASIAFSGTTYADNKTVGLVIKDASGNDITPDFDLTDEEVISVESSNENVVGTDLVTNYTGSENAAQYAVVNVKLLGDEGKTLFETGNTIITVKGTLDVATTIDAVTLSADPDSETFAKTDLALSASETDQYLATKVLDQDGVKITDVALSVTYRSLNPSIALVDEESGYVSPIKTGTASVLVKATYNGKTVSKTVTVEVKANAEKKSLSAVITNSKLVLGSDIENTLTIKVLDQYGDVFPIDTTAQVTTSKDGVIADLSKTATAVTITDGVAELPIELDEDAVKGTATIKIVAADYTKSVSISVVEAGTFAGYAAVVSSTNLDVNGDAADTELDSAVTVNVYKKDVNGNYIGKAATDGVTVTLVDAEEASEGGAVEIDGLDVVAYAAGTESVTVYVDSVKVATLKFTVVNTASTLTKVTQVKNSLSVTASTDLFAAIQGAFTVKDQYGTTLTLAADKIAVHSSKESLIPAYNAVDAADGDWTAVSGQTGSATLIVIINDVAYTLTVVVR